MSTADPRIRMDNIRGYRVPVLNNAPISIPVLAEEPTLAQEDIEEIKRFIKSVTPLSDGACIIMRHCFPKKIGNLYTPQQARERGNRLTITGTVVKTVEKYHLPNGDVVESKVKVGDIVGFSAYGPFAAYPRYEQLQLLHNDEILFKLDTLPPGVEEPFSLDEFIQAG